MTYTQDRRHLAIETVLGPDALLVRGLHGAEAVSRPFHVTLELTSDALSIDAARLLGTPACVTIALPSGGNRCIHGLVSRFRQSGAGTAAATSATSYEAEVVPWLWMLSLSTDCRIFQNVSVPDIVTQTFDDLGFGDYRLALTRSYPPRDFCVQYRETHLDFVSRLLEDEGIFYYFEHEPERHTLVLSDSVAASRPVSGLASLRAAPTNDGAWGDDTYAALTVERAVHTHAVALADYNYLTPSAPLQAALQAANGPRTAFDYPGGYADAGEGDRYTRLRLEEAESGRVTATGTSHAPALTSGYAIGLTGNARRASDGSWFVLALRHAATQGGFVAGQADAPFAYRNEFTLVPADVAWRPPRRTPRPHVHGTQSALVVGPAGEEIFTDEHGRVKLHFYWDRRSQRNENSSCWVRCSTAWAGRGYGQFSVPRIGQEVLVDFLEGDPDRPVVVGRVYNAEQRPPCDPGGSRGVTSGMRSQTHKGAGYNAMEMTDTAGKEKISIHAQYDMDTVVGHDDTQTVKNNRTVKITEGVLDEDVVAGTATYHVKGAVAERYEATQATTVTGDITIVSQTGGIAIAADAQHVYIKGTTSIQLHVGASTIWMDAGGQIKIDGVNVTINGSSNVTITGGTVHSEAKSQHQTKGAIVLSEGSATNTIKGGMVMLNP